MKPCIRRVRVRTDRGQQCGYVMLIVLLALAMMVIGLTAAAPRIAQQIKRDREVELMHRGDQYSRAVKRYVHKFPGRYPTSIEQLENTNNIRFLRKKYKDPMTPDGIWKIVHLGEVQMGQSSALNGATPAANIGDDEKNKGANKSSSSLFSSSAQTFGGGPILGVASLSEAQGIHEFDNKRKYNQWMFVYDQAQDMPNLLLKGPYNPKAFFGKSGNIPGAVSPDQMNKTPPPQPGPDTDKPQR